MSTLQVRINWLIARTRKALEHTHDEGPRWSLEEQLRQLLRAQQAKRGNPHQPVALPAFVTFDGNNFHSTDRELPGVIPGEMFIADDEQ